MEYEKVPDCIRSTPIFAPGLKDTASDRIENPSKVPALRGRIGNRLIRQARVLDLLNGTLVR